VTRLDSRLSVWSIPSLGLYLALLAATLLRVWSLGAHLPFGPGVDEPEVMERAVRIMKTGDLNPHFFDYPSLYIYIEAIASTLRFLSGAIEGRWSALAQAPTEEFYLWGRTVTAMFGIATVWLLHRAGLYWGRRTALLAAVMLAVMPLHVRESHYTLTDVPSTFFVTLTLLLSLRAHDTATAWSFVLAGAAAGLAGATKYNAGLAVIMPLIACAMTPAARASRSVVIPCVLVAALIAFLLAAPYTFLDLPHFLNGFARLASEFRAPSNTSNPGWMVYLKQLRTALQWPGSLIVLAGLVLGVVRFVTGPDRLKWILPLVFSAVYFYFVAHQNIFYGRYLLPMVPTLSLLGAAAIIGIADMARRTSMPGPARRSIIVALTLLAIVPPAYSSIRFDANESLVWTTEEAYWWIVRTLPPGTHIAIEGSVSFHLPPTYVTVRPIQLRRNDVTFYKRNGIQYLIASSQVYGQYVEPKDYPVENADYQRLFAETREVMRFIPSPEHPGPELRVLQVR